MKRIVLGVLACAGIVFNSTAATNFAARVLHYDPGANAAAGYTNVDAVLGEPSQLDPFGFPIDPFNPPYGAAQILSIGEGGSLTIKFDEPIFNTRRKPFGLDFIIFGNSGFIITNEFDPTTFGWIGTPATDGSLFANNMGETRVSVSMNGSQFFELDPVLAPGVDTLFPTDGFGQFDLPVNPALTATDFAGATLDDMRTLYRGSGGGAGYDINWARTASGKPVNLPYIRFVRVEVVSGKVEIDAFSAVSRSKHLPK